MTNSLGRRLCLALLGALLCFLSLSPAPLCAREAETPAAGGQSRTAMSPEAKAQEQEAFYWFKKILPLMDRVEDKTVRPRIKGLYRKIIRDYPEAPLAQESYWRLIRLYVEDRTPGSTATARELHDEFLRKYPDSVLKKVIAATLAEAAAE